MSDPVPLSFSLSPASEPEVIPEHEPGPVPGSLGEGVPLFGRGWDQPRQPPTVQTRPRYLWQGRNSGLFPHDVEQLVWAARIKVFRSVKTKMLF